MIISGHTGAIVCCKIAMIPKGQCLNYQSLSTIATAPKLTEKNVLNGILALQLYSVYSHACYLKGLPQHDS